MYAIVSNIIKEKRGICKINVKYLKAGKYNIDLYSYKLNEFLRVIKHKFNGFNSPGTTLRLKRNRSCI